MYDRSEEKLARTDSFSRECSTSVYDKYELRLKIQRTRSWLLESQLQSYTAILITAKPEDPPPRFSYIFLFPRAREERRHRSRLLTPKAAHA